MCYEQTSRCTASSTSAGSRWLLAPGELRAVAGGLRDPVERARVAGAAFAAESYDGAGRGQRVSAAAALRKETRSGAVGMSKPLKSVGGWVYLQAYLGDYGA